jgi:hypothetical protein
MMRCRSVWIHARPSALCPALWALLAGMLLPVNAHSAAGCTGIDLEVASLRAAIEQIEGYDIDATTNQPRFVAEFLFALASEVRARGLSSFRVPQRYFQAWKEATGKTEADAPVGMRRVLEFDQRFVVELDPEVRLRLPEAHQLRQMLAVRAGWPEAPGRAAYYSYADTTSDPDVLLRQQRDIRYLLLDFGDFVAYEQVDGIAGKPTSGGLGALFKLLGLADLRSTRMAIATDDLQVNRTRVAKLFTFTAIALVQPDGQAERGIPADRPDLQALADRLDLDFDVDAPARWPELCD